MKRNKNWMMVAFLLLAEMMTGCNEDNPAVSYDTENQIEYYTQPLYADLEQGYWYNSLGTIEDVFTDLIPNKEAPYYLLVCPKNEKGRKTLEYMASQKNGVIVELQQRSTGYSEPLGYPDDRYFVTSTKYFESPDLYVSDNYFFKDGSSRPGNFCRIVPLIVISLKEGYDIKDIENKYKDVLTRQERTQNGGDSLSRLYYFICDLNNSYEVLRVASEIYKRDDVNWAEPDMYTPIYLD